MRMRHPVLVPSCAILFSSPQVSHSRALSGIRSLDGKVSKRLSSMTLFMDSIQLASKSPVSVNVGHPRSCLAGSRRECKNEVSEAAVGIGICPMWMQDERIELANLMPIANGSTYCNNMYCNILYMYCGSWNRETLPTAKHSLAYFQRGWGDGWQQALKSQPPDNLLGGWGVGKTVKRDSTNANGQALTWLLPSSQE